MQTCGLTNSTTAAGKTNTATFLVDNALPWEYVVKPWMSDGRIANILLKLHKRNTIAQFYNLIALAEQFIKAKYYDAYQRFGRWLISAENMNTAVNTYKHLSIHIRKEPRDSQLSVEVSEGDVWIQTYWPGALWCRFRHFYTKGKNCYRDWRYVFPILDDM